MRLNSNQQLAVETIDGPVMVIAGPGTGKTQIIAERIAQILKTTDTPADAILALTFTESGAKEMKERLLQTIGPSSYYVNISTFHAFCSSVIQEFPDRFVIAADLEPLSDLERVEIFQQIIKSYDFDLLKPANQPFYYLPALIKTIQDLKREAVSPQVFKAILKQETAGSKEAKRNLLKNKELVKVYRAYQKVLRQRGRYDFEDMVNFVVEAFKKDAALLRTYQERFLYFLVDEYQDTNSAQNQVVDLLASYWGDQANVFVVGDSNQCLPAGTKVVTKTGSRNIETLRPGEEVLTAVGKGYTSFTKIKRVFKQKKKVKLITFTTETGKKITATDNHKMFCFLPPREVSDYWYVYLMYKKSLGWRIGITKSLSIRLKIEAGADKIVGLKSCQSEAEAKYWELVLSLRYKIPTVVFKDRGNAITGEWLQKLYQEFDTENNAQLLAQDLGINLNQAHYLRDATTFGDGRIKINLVMCSRNYRTKYDKDGLLKHPAILHELQIETSNIKVVKKLRELGFKLRNKNIGKGLRLNSVDFSKLMKTAKLLEREIGGFIDIKASLGTTRLQHRSARVMQAGNLLTGNYLPVLKGYEVFYDRIIKREEKIVTAEIYDLEVPPSHNFIANGVVVHNSIYRFQGASLENIIGFTKTYPTAKVIALDKNYRSTQLILDGSFQLIRKNRLKIEDIVAIAKPKLTAVKTYPPKPLSIIETPSEHLESFWLAQKIKKLIDSGIKPEETAVIYRHNDDADEFSQMLNKFNISVDIEGGANVLEDAAIKKLITLFTVIESSPKNLEDLDLFHLFHYEFFQFDPLDALKLCRLASKNKTTIVETILSDQFKQLNLNQPEQFINFLDQLVHWQQLDSRTTFPKFFETLIKESGFLDWLVTLPDASQKLNRLNSLFSEIKRLSRADHRLNLSSFLKALGLMASNNLKIAEADLDIKTNSVTLTTAHKAKGKEWAYVFIVKAIDTKWGNNKVRELIKLPERILQYTDLTKKEPNEDERRLFYVSLTRAKQQVFITYSQRYSQNGVVREALPSMFIAETPDRYKKIIKTQFTQNAKMALTKLLSPAVTQPPGIEEKAYLKTLLNDFKLSATALNTYLTCSYKFKLNNLIRVPRAKPSFMAFGTAVHKALEKFYRQFIDDDRYPRKDWLLNRFELALTQELLTGDEFAIRLKQGRKALSAYYDNYQDDLIKPLAVEKFFGYGWAKTRLDNIVLTGKIDRIDWVDQQERTVRVVDYKTGSPKTRNQILGKTKDADLDYYRQLVFYKLLSRLDRSFQPEVVEAELDFVEADKRTGKFRKERFKISPDEVKTLRREIKTSMAEIRKLNFSRTSDYRHCQRCEYKLHCWPEGIPTQK